MFDVTLGGQGAWLCKQHSCACENSKLKQFSLAPARTATGQRCRSRGRLRVATRCGHTALGSTRCYARAAGSRLRGARAPRRRRRDTRRTRRPRRAAEEDEADREHAARQCCHWLSSPQVGCIKSGTRESRRRGLSWPERAGRRRHVMRAHRALLVCALVITATTAAVGPRQLRTPTFAFREIAQSRARAL